MLSHHVVGRGSLDSTNIDRAIPYIIRHPWGTEWVVRDDLHTRIGVIRLSPGRRLMRHTGTPVNRVIWVKSGMIRVLVDGDIDGLERVYFPGCSFTYHGVSELGICAIGRAELVEVCGCMPTDFSPMDADTPLPPPYSD